MRVTATAKFIRISPRKVRLVTDLIAGKPVEEAAAILRFLPNAAARDVAKVLKSATANAENNFNLSADELTVVSATADEGPTLKRWRPRAQGRTFGILKRTSHITIAVAGEVVRRSRLRDAAAGGHAHPAARRQAAGQRERQPGRDRARHQPRHRD